MRRSLRIGLGLAGVVAGVRGGRWVSERLVPAGARGALGAVAQVTTLAQTARRELAAGTAEREAELRADLLAGADLTRSRALVDAWRAERAERAGQVERAESSQRSGPVARGGHADAVRHAERAAPGDAPDPQPDATAAAGTGSDTPRRTRRAGTGSHRLEDPDDGPLGYSFF